MEPTAIPFFDPGIEYATISKIRGLNAKNLKAMRRPLAFSDRKGVPLGIVIPYQLYLQMQRILLAAYGRQ